MTRTLRVTLETMLFPLPAFVWWANRLSVSTLLTMLGGLLTLAGAAAAGLVVLRRSARAVPEASCPCAEPERDDPADKLRCERADLVARLERLEHHVDWLTSGVEDAEAHANAPDGITFLRERNRRAPG